MIPFSVLDLSIVTEESDVPQAFGNTLDLAQHVERWGYKRFWLAEHHNMPGVASAATSIVIAHVAAGTSSIRVGAGGIMLPNHAPLVVAEQFGTLASLFPDRIDLGLGRAPGSDQVTARALRRTLASDPEEFPRDVIELMSYFDEPVPGQQVRAVPGAGTQVPIWILGSSLFGAQVAAALGLPFAFASHFAPAYLMDAITLYRRSFRPSEQRAEPYVMAAINVIAADTDEEARYLATSQQQAFVNLRRGQPGRLPPPRENFLESLEPFERAMIEQTLMYSAIGSPDTVHRFITDFIDRTRADEIIIASQVYDHHARLRSYEITFPYRR